MQNSLQEKENYQQICFLNSKLVFFFGSDQKNAAREFHQDGKKTLMRKSARDSLQDRNRSQKGKNKIFTSSNLKKLFTSTNSKRVKVQKQSKSFQFGSHNQSRLQKIHADKKCNEGQILVHTEQTTRKTEVMVDRQSFYQLKHNQIKYFLGQHHKLYKKNMDYLIKPALLPPLRDIQLQKANQCIYTQQQFVPSLHMKSSRDEGLIIPTFHSSYRRSYAFENQRAPIAEGIMNRNLYQLYNKVIKQNYKSQKFMDRQFSHQNFSKINGKPVKWIYKTPNPSLLVFPISHNKNRQKIQKSMQKIPFVCFMELLYQIQPQIFTRLFEPPINNAFSVWLFFNNLFQPVVIDGYFPIDQCQKYLFGDADNLWITIFTKCICKVFQTYNIQNLKNISDFEIYRILTGKKLKQISLAHFGNQDEKIVHFVRRQKNKNRTLVCRNSQNFFIVHQNQCKKLIKDIKQKGQKYMKSLYFYLVSKPQPTYIATFSVLSEMITKFQIFCSGICQLTFLLPNQKIQQYSRVYIYENQGNEQLNRLKLIHQLNPGEQKGVKLLAGNYKIFYEDGKKLMKNIFSQSLGRQITKKNGTYTVTLMGSCPIKLSQGQLLQKCNGMIEDSRSFYRSG